MARRVLWVVEMWNEDAKRWEPTVGCGISRDSARREKRTEWDPQCGRHRVVAYAPKEQQRRKASK